MYAAGRLVSHPLTLDRWPDLDRLFAGRNGDCARCWCMWWRVTRQEFQKNRSAGNREGLKAIVSGGQTPGLLTYLDGQPVGWCSVGPREAYAALERSRRLARVDDEPVWSIVCFVVDRAHRGRGLMDELLRAAVTYSAQHGARIVEAYPKDPTAKPVSQSASYTGILSAFRKAGFVEVARRTKNQPIMRYFVQPQ